MTDFDFDQALDVLAASDFAGAIEALRDLRSNWEASAQQCRTMLADYVSGADLSERTERALFYIVHALGEMAETATHADLCRLAEDAERTDLVLGEDVPVVTFPRILVSTFNGDPAPLQRLAEAEAADEMVRGNALLILAYLTRTRRLPEAWMQDYLAELAERPEPADVNFFWFGWVNSVAALGFAGLAPQAERLMRDGFVDPNLMSPKEFWGDLRAAQADPAEMSEFAWGGIEPMGDAVEELSSWPLGLEETTPSALQPVINPLRNLGRNDPCPCGSGKKFKKCCLGATF